MFGAELRILQIQVKPDKESNNREETKQCVIVETAPHSFAALPICHSGFRSEINIRNGCGRRIYTKLKKKVYKRRDDVWVSGANCGKDILQEVVLPESLQTEQY